MGIKKTSSPVALLLLTLVLCALLGCASVAAAAEKKEYEIVSAYVPFTSSNLQPAYCSLSLLTCWTDNGSCVATGDGSMYCNVHRLVEDDSDVVVVRRNQVVFMLYDETIIGAEFDDPDLRLQAAYPGFAIMQSAAYMDRKFEKAMQIGLGIGTVPSFLRHMKIPTGASM